eukprot:1827995-Alexandrium_andersonii.AAC.1
MHDERQHVLVRRGCVRLAGRGIDMSHSDCFGRFGVGGPVGVVLLCVSRQSIKVGVAGAGRV